MKCIQDPRYRIALHNGLTSYDLKYHRQTAAVVASPLTVRFVSVRFGEAGVQKICSTVDGEVIGLDTLTVGRDIPMSGGGGVRAIGCT